MPILQLGLSGDNLSEQQLNDLGLNFLRTQLVTVPGATIPYPYGGKQRQVTIAFNPARLQAKGLSPTDVLNAVNAQDLVLPSGTAKISQFEYDVRTNAAPRTIEQLNDLPIRTVGNATIYLRDVATVSDGFAPQTNIVRMDGKRGVLVTILKAGAASTINVVDDIRALLPRVQQTLPAQLHVRPIGDQSIFVKAAVADVLREAVIAACLTALMILLFLGSWRSTLIIAVSIPLSILTSVMVLSALGETINIMTLGGLALAVGILVDDATVTIENMERYLEDGQPLREAILNGASQIAVPALVSTLCICIVFVPMFLLQGVARYLFMPLAEAVVFAMLASYFLSRTLVPTMAMYLLRREPHAATRSRNPLVIFQRGFERGFERTRYAYRDLLTLLVRRRGVFIPGFLAGCLALFALWPMARPGLLPQHRQRAVHPSHAREDRHPHRGNRAARRPSRDRDAAGDPGARAGHDRRQYRPAVQRHEPDPHLDRRARRGGRGHHGLAQARSPTDRRLPLRQSAGWWRKSSPASRSIRCRPT